MTNEIDVINPVDGDPSNGVIFTVIANEITVRWKLYQLTPDYMLMDTIDQIISSLPAHTTSGYFEQEWMPIPGTAGIGTCRVVFIVDPENTIVELNENNNELSMDFDIDIFM